MQACVKRVSWQGILTCIFHIHNRLSACIYTLSYVMLCVPHQHIYIYIHMYVCMYIYIYISRQYIRSSSRASQNKHTQCYFHKACEYIQHMYHCICFDFYIRVNGCMNACMSACRHVCTLVIRSRAECPSQINLHDHVCNEKTINVTNLCMRSRMHKKSRNECSCSSLALPPQQAG